MLPLLLPRLVLAAPRRQFLAGGAASSAPNLAATTSWPRFFGCGEGAGGWLLRSSVPGAEKEHGAAGGESRLEAFFGLPHPSQRIATMIPAPSQTRMATAMVLTAFPHPTDEQPGSMLTLQPGSTPIGRRH